MRIVSLAPSNTEILYALGVGRDIVAVTAFCNYPESAKKKPKTGGWTSTQVLTVKKFNPDIVFTSTFLQDHIVKELNGNNIKVVHVDPKTLDDVFKSIQTIGKAIGKENLAKQLIYKIKTEIKSLQQYYFDRVGRNRKRVYIEEWHEPPMVSGNWVPGIVKLAGGKYDLIREGEISRKITLEEIKKYDPEIIILSLCGYGFRPSPDIISKRKGWEQISAVKNKKVYVFDDDYLNRPGPRLVLGLKQLVKIIHEN